MKRKYRDREHQENVTIIIPVVICPTARAQGNQYTKRLLPGFLIPHSVIRLDHLLEASSLPKTERSETVVCDLIGCLDARTARRRMHGLTTAIEMVSLDLTERRAATPELGDLPEIRPGTPIGERLAILFDSEIRSGERAGRIQLLPPLRQLLQAAMGNRDGNKPSNCVSHADRPP